MNIYPTEVYLDQPLNSSISRQRLTPMVSQYLLDLSIPMDRIKLENCLRKYLDGKAQVHPVYMVENGFLQAATEL